MLTLVKEPEIPCCLRMKVRDSLGIYATSKRRRLSEKASGSASVQHQTRQPHVIAEKGVKTGPSGRLAR